MNPQSKFAVIGENVDVLGGKTSWSIHLHQVQPSAKGPVIEQAPLCQRTILNPARIRNFGMREAFKTAHLAPGYAICGVCEQLRSDEPEQFLYAVIVAKKEAHPEAPWKAQREPEWYLHAKGDAEAREQAAHLCDSPLVRVEHVGRVVGYHVEDSDGKVLRA